MVDGSISINYFNKYVAKNQHLIMQYFIINWQHILFKLKYTVYTVKLDEVYDIQVGLDRAQNPSCQKSGGVSASIVLHNSGGGYKSPALAGFRNNG